MARSASASPTVTSHSRTLPQRPTRSARSRLTQSGGSSPVCAAPQWPASKEQSVASRPQNKWSTYGAPSGAPYPPASTTQSNRAPPHGRTPTMSSMIVISATAGPTTSAEPSPAAPRSHTRALRRHRLLQSPRRTLGSRHRLYQRRLAVLAHPADNEQGFQLRTAGTRRREPIDFGGLTLIAFHREGQDLANPT